MILYFSNKCMLAKLRIWQWELHLFFLLLFLVSLLWLPLFTTASFTLLIFALLPVFISATTSGWEWWWTTSWPRSSSFVLHPRTRPWRMFSATLRWTRSRSRRARIWSGSLTRSLRRRRPMPLSTSLLSSLSWIRAPTSAFPPTPMQSIIWGVPTFCRRHELLGYVEWFSRTRNLWIEFVFISISGPMEWSRDIFSHKVPTSWILFISFHNLSSEKSELFWYNIAHLISHLWYNYIW